MLLVRKAKSYTRPYRWGFLAGWVLASFVGLLVGTVAFVAAGVLAGDVVDRLPEFTFGLVLAVSFGPTFGVAQGLILRRHLRRSAGAWIGATLVGFMVAFVVIFGLMDGSNPDSALLVKLGHAVVLGGALGLAQWSLLLRRLEGASLWIAISLVSWVLAELVGVALTALVGPPFNLLGLFLVGSALPGIGMAWLLGPASAWVAKPDGRGEPTGDGEKLLRGTRG